MAERTPLYMDINNVYSGDEMGLPNRDFISEGIVLATDMAVTAGAGNTVNIAAGACWIVGDTDIVNQPTYRIINDATVNLGINPDPTNPRIVRVGMQINDAGFSGVLRNGVLTAIHGTPVVGPVAPAEPASFLTLATVLVPAAAASSAAYTFTDLRPRARVGAGQALASGGMTLICDLKLGASQATIDTNAILGGNIPATFNHLRAYLYVRDDAAATNGTFHMRCNNDSGANYDSIAVEAQASTQVYDEVIAGTQIDVGLIPGATAPANSFAQYVFDIANYADTTNHKVITATGGAKWTNSTGNLRTIVLSAFYRNAAALNRLAFLPNGANFVVGSRFSLYGIT